MDNSEMCKYCNSLGCSKRNLGLSAQKCLPPITSHDKWIIKKAKKMYKTSFQQPVVVVDGILSAFFRIDLNPPHVLLNVDQIGAAYAFYLFQTIGADKVGLVPTKLLQEAFCRLVVFRTALHFASQVDDNQPKPLPHRRFNLFDCPILNKFIDSLVDLIIDCKEADFYRTEVHLLYAMLATHHDNDEWIEDELGLLPAFYHYEAETYANSRCFRQDKVMGIFYAVKRVVRETGTRALLSPIHSTAISIFSEYHLLILASFLYSHSI